MIESDEPEIIYLYVDETGDVIFPGPDQRSRWIEVPELGDGPRWNPAAATPTDLAESVTAGYRVRRYELRKYHCSHIRVKDWIGQDVERAKRFVRGVERSAEKWLSL